MQPDHIRAKWEPHVGKFVLAFTAIEHLVTISIDLISNKSISKTARTLLFDKRTELLLELLKSSKEITPESKAKFAAHLDKAVQLSRNARNLVAHNHILLELYKNEADGMLYESEYIISSRNRNKKMSLSNLAEYALEAENLAKEAGNTYLSLVGEYYAR